MLLYAQEGRASFLGPELHFCGPGRFKTAKLPPNMLGVPNMSFGHAIGVEILIRSEQISYEQIRNEQIRTEQIRNELSVQSNPSFWLEMF